MLTLMRNAVDIYVTSQHIRVQHDESTDKMSIPNFLLKIIIRFGVKLIIH